MLRTILGDISCSQRADYARPTLAQYHPSFCKSISTCFMLNGPSEGPAQ